MNIDDIYGQGPPPPVPSRQNSTDLERELVEDEDPLSMMASEISTAPAVPARSTRNYQDLSRMGATYPGKPIRQIKKVSVPVDYRLAAAPEERRSAPPAVVVVGESAKKNYETDFLSKCKVPPPSSTDTIPENMPDIIALFRRGSYERVVSAARKKKQLFDPQSHFSQEWFAWTMFEFASLLLTKSRVEAAELLESLGNVDQCAYRKEVGSHSENNGCKSMVPFPLRVLIEEFIASVGSKEGAIVDRLKALSVLIENGCVYVESEAGEQAVLDLGLTEHGKCELKLCMLEYTVGKLVNRSDYFAAQQLSSKQLADASANGDIKRKANVLLGISRMYMHMGDVKGAQRFHEESRAICESLSNPWLLSTRILLNHGLCLFTLSKYSEAFEAFEAVLNACIEATTKPESNEANTIICPRELMITAANNTAVCALHVGKARRAVDAIEQTLQLDPSKYMAPQLVKNLNILYSLVFSPTTAAAKKKALVTISLKYGISAIVGEKAWI